MRVVCGVTKKSDQRGSGSACAASTIDSVEKKILSAGF